MKHQDPYDPDPTPKLEREQRLRLFQQLHQAPEMEDMDHADIWRRGNGFILCKLCKCPCREHPLFDEFLFYVEPTDRRLCNGDVIHP